MQCQTDTLNSFRPILMDAQSQGLSLHTIRSAVLAWKRSTFIRMLLFSHPNISLSPSKLSSVYPFLPRVSLTFYVPSSLSPFHSLPPHPHLFLLVCSGCFLFSLLFFMHDVSLNNFKKSKFGFLSLSAPICLFVPPLLFFFFPSFSVIVFFLCLSCSLSARTSSAETERSPTTESVGVYEQE